MGGKHSPVIKFYHFISYFKRKVALKNSAKDVAWRLNPSPFVFTKNLAQSLENEIFENSLCSKAIKIFQNQDKDFL